MQTRLLLIAATLLCIATGAGAHDLTGTWVFEKETNTRADGSEVKLENAQYDGLLIYTADGHVSANVMPRGRAWRVDTATREQLHASIGEGAATAYAGRYEVDAGKGTVTHIPGVSLDPADTGQRLVRQFKLVGDRLLLSGKWKYQGEELTFTVHWVRAAAAAR